MKKLYQQLKTELNAIAAQLEEAKKQERKEVIKQLRCKKFEIIARQFPPLLALFILFQFTLIIFRALFRGEMHIIKFYFDTRMVKPLGIYRFSSPLLENVARHIDETAEKVIGEEYSGATDAEVVSGLAICIEQSVGKKSALKYLEIGSARGKSMALIGQLAVSKNLQFSGISVDPYFDDAYTEGKDEPLRYLTRRGTYTAPIDISCRKQAIDLWDALALDVEQLRMTSSHGITHLHKRKESFDLIYIDGLHDGLTPITDFIGVLRLVNNGSVVILDDRHWVNVHYLRKICDNTPALLKVFENWKITAYCIKDSANLLR